MTYKIKIIIIEMAAFTRKAKTKKCMTMWQNWHKLKI